MLKIVSTSSIYSESAYLTDFSREHNITPIWPSVSVTLCGVFSAIIIKLHNWDNLEGSFTVPLDFTHSIHRIKT